ncbi:MAG: hypothetical protein IJ802_03505 [Kiritimatiellae bacterium]|nr:hypothetical protein [Kiritimatiellia bacterium]
MNITLSAPPETVQIVRQWAEQQHTSLNRYIRDLLDAKAQDILAERREAARKFASFMDTVRITVPPGWKFDREEANAR